jgi:hypothetical protein
MTKPKYATLEERKAAWSAAASKWNRERWERRRQESGKPLGYEGCHFRVRAARGRAADQFCVECGKQAQHWAHIHGTDPAEPQNYQPMCRRCHSAYDGTGAKAVKTAGPEGRRALALKAWETKRRKRANAS